MDAALTGITRSKNSAGKSSRTSNKNWRIRKPGDTNIEELEDEFGRTLEEQVRNEV
jgi:hypothetical protein